MVRADPPLAEPQVPDALAVEPLERQPRREAAGGDRGLDRHLDPVAAVARDERGGAAAAARRSPARRPRRRAQPPSTRTLRASACGGSGSTTSASPPPSRSGRTRSSPSPAVHDPHRAEPSVLQAGQSRFSHARGPAARRGERGERQLGLALVLAGAERRAQRLGAVAAQHELGASPVAPTTSTRPSWISTRRATASAVPPAATRPSVPAPAASRTGRPRRCRRA